jgi:Domain of unknown function (DUF4337)
MGDLIDGLTEVGDHGLSGLNTTVAMLVAISATFVALCNVKDGNIVQAMAQAQANSVDAWSYYQAKSTKQNIAEGMVDQLTTQRDVTPGLLPDSRSTLDRRIAEYAAKAKQYDVEKQQIKKTAEDYQRDYDRLNFRDDQFDMAEATLSLSIALLGITALTQKRWLLAVAVVFAAFGVALGVSGFMGYNIHPSFIAKLLS